MPYGRLLATLTANTHFVTSHGRDEYLLRTWSNDVVSDVVFSRRAISGERWIGTTALLLVSAGSASTRLGPH